MNIDQVYTEDIEQFGAGGKCSLLTTRQLIGELIKSAWSTSKSDGWKNIMDDVKIVKQYHQQNIDNYKILKFGSKIAKNKPALPPTLRLRWDWDKLEKEENIPWLSSKLIFLYRCTLNDVNGKKHDMMFAFNLVELQRQIITTSCIATLLKNKDLAGFSLSVFNPVTQIPFTDDTAILLKYIYFVKELNINLVYVNKLYLTIF